MEPENVNPYEVEKFNRLAHRWWDPSSEFKPLHDINPLRVQYIAERVPLAGAKVLDVGCGGGLLAEALAARGADVFGIDESEAAIAVAQLHAAGQDLTVRYQKISAAAHVEQVGAVYDVVTCLEVLEHVPDPEALIATIARALKPGGHAFFATINRNPKAFLFAIVGAEYILRLLPKGTHEYKNFIRPSELARSAAQYGLWTKDLTGMTYNPFTKVYRLTPRDVSVNYLLHAQKEHD